MTKRRDPNQTNIGDRLEREANIKKGGSTDVNGVVRRVRAKKTDWDLFSRAYINAYEKELVELCFEVTKNPDDPKYDTAREKCREGKWNDLKRIQMANDSEYMGKLNSELSSYDYTTAETIRDSRLQLVDANKTIQRHLNVAGELSAIVSYHTPKILAASEYIDWQNLAMEDPKAFFGAMKDLTAIMDTVIKIERTSLDLANVKIDIVQKTEPIKQTKDLSNLTDAELSALYTDTLRTIDITND